MCCKFDVNFCGVKDLCKFLINSSPIFWINSDVLSVHFFFTFVFWMIDEIWKRVMCWRVLSMFFFDMFFHGRKVFKGILTMTIAANKNFTLSQMSVPLSNFSMSLTQLSKCSRAYSLGPTKLSQWSLQSGPQATSPGSFDCPTARVVTNCTKLCGQWRPARSCHALWVVLNCL